MPKIIKALADAANPFTVLTRSPLILRDLPLLREAAKVTRVSVAVSVGFVDDRLRRGPGARRGLAAAAAGDLRGAERGGGAVRGADGAHPAADHRLGRPPARPRSGGRPRRGRCRWCPGCCGCPRGRGTRSWGGWRGSIRGWCRAHEELSAAAGR